jgi:DNA (cytosine-5)-methyltransferase 1
MPHPTDTPDEETGCLACQRDLGWLRSTVKPRQMPVTRGRLRSVDLFSGCGGLSLGLSQAAAESHLSLEIALAVDTDTNALSTFSSNLRCDRPELAPVETLFGGDLGQPRSHAERRVQQEIGEIEILSGGPPCQGYSGLNAYRRNGDTRNTLYLRMARAAEVLRPRLVLIENVPEVATAPEGVVQRVRETLSSLGYESAEMILNGARLGLPQKRRRHVLIASLDPTVRPEAVLGNLRPACETHPARSVSWAISDLVSKQGTSRFDTSAKLSDANSVRAAWLLDRDEYDLPNYLRPHCHQGLHRYKAMYGRLTWGSAAPTISSGFGSMGQGRFVHPLAARTLTPHEAARLQTFPDWFDFGPARPRTSWSNMIGNAVPPLLNRVIGLSLFRELTGIGVDIGVSPEPIAVPRP